jgi:hypothetical protein
MKFPRPVSRGFGCAALFVCLLLGGNGVGAEEWVKGYTRKDGTVVPGYYKTAPNKTKNDNYSTKGNVNPHTGKPGTKPRDGEVSPVARPKQELKVVKPKVELPPRIRGREELQQEIASKERIMDKWLRQNSFNTPERDRVTTPEYEAVKEARDQAQRELNNLPSK